MIILFGKPLQKLVRLCFPDSFVDEINQQSDAAVIIQALTKKSTKVFRAFSRQHVQNKHLDPFWRQNWAR